jgi:oxygen-independent coproporphyrinogen-3 oxidase
MFIYLHVPFCLSRCVYCDFYVVLDKYGGHEAYVDAVCREIDLRFASINVADFPQGIQTLYVGGGTPSLLDAAAYRRIFKKLNEYLPFAGQAEITLEANPGARRSEMVDSPKAYRECGFNRVSVGVQTLNNNELKKLSRLHSAEEAEEFIRGLQRAGWANISLDLMYGIPLQTEASWQETLQRAIALNVQHISMYGLKVEENTPLETLTTLPLAKGSYPLPEEEAVVDMYFTGLSTLAQAGFCRYEFSNLAQPGFESRHNLNYWNNGEFLALGVAAHGYWQGQRYETVPDLQRYLNNPLAGITQACPTREQLENAIIFGLRKAEGIDTSALERAFGIDFRQRYGAVLDRYAGKALIWEGHRLRLEESAIPLSNSILAEFLGDD